MVGLGGKSKTRNSHHLSFSFSTVVNFPGSPCFLSMPNSLLQLFHMCYFWNSIPRNSWARLPVFGASQHVSWSRYTQCSMNHCWLKASWAGWDPPRWVRCPFHMLTEYPVLPLSVVTSTLRSRLFPGVCSARALASHVLAASHPAVYSSNVSSSEGPPLTTLAVVPL